MILGMKAILAEIRASIHVRWISQTTLPLYGHRTILRLSDCKDKEKYFLVLNLFGKPL